LGSISHHITTLTKQCPNEVISAAEDEEETGAGEAGVVAEDEAAPTSSRIGTRKSRKRKTSLI
jgi:hypothetical protein